MTDPRSTCEGCGQQGERHNDPAMIAPATYECVGCGTIWTNPPAELLGFGEWLTRETP